VYKFSNLFTYNMRLEYRV